MVSLRRVKVGEVVHLERTPVAVDPFGTYTSIGIRSFGRGIFHYEPTLGADLPKLRFFGLKPGRLVVSNIKGWEGAIAVSSESDESSIASNRFLSYVPDPNRADARFLRYFFLSEAGLPLIQRASPGSADRNRTLAIDRFEALEIPLPDISEQRRLATRLDVILSLVATVEERLRQEGGAKWLATFPSLIAAVFKRHSGGAAQTVAHLVDIVNDIVHPGDDPGPAAEFVGLQHVESHSGRRTGSDPIGDEKGRKFRFQPGDIVFGYLRPYLNKIWLADRHGLCSVDQYVLRPRAGVDGALLGYALRSRTTLDRAIEMTHSLQLPRLRSGLLESIVMPWPDASGNATLRTQLDKLSRATLAAVDLRRRQFEITRSLTPSILNRAFADLR